MESTQNLKRRMRSVQNIGQITKAMELVAATKMRHAQELALGSRPYAFTALEMLGAIAGLKDVPQPEILRGRAPEEKTGRIVFMLVTSDKGLAGSFNSAIFRKFEVYVRENHIDVSARNTNGEPVYSFFAVGQKAKAYLEHRNLPVAHTFLRVGDFTKIEEARPMSSALIDGYLHREFDEVIAFSTQFVTALHQEVLVRQLLPISREKIEESMAMLIPQAGKYSQYLKPESLRDAENDEYIIEPSPKEVLQELAPELLRIRIYHMILEANASEHSARRVAMKNASDNARDISDDLTIEYNKSRQAAITNQILEVTSGAAAME